MEIRPYAETDHDRLVDIWHRAVIRTHDFLTEEDISYYYGFVQGGALNSVEIWVARDESGEPSGFVGLDGAKVEMLFVDPERHGQGTGKALLDHVVALKGKPVTVDVNEQNGGALGFYRRYGFEQIGRSELDGSGKPFPLLHLKLDS
ncbi:acetyltransferase [Paenibacillus hodogayensis]|uniref:Acetyltransferase n=1 Tax=Paenibacillus hodogayensis TaxID=279208 RepID=A0ABV5VS40_9BACL